MTRTSEPFTVPAVVVAGATRVLTSHRIFSDPTPLAQVFAFVHALVEQPNHVASPSHLEIFEGLCRTYDATGDLAGDAHLAAIALEHDCTLVSIDRDFARFAELRWEIPDRDL